MRNNIHMNTLNSKYVSGRKRLICLGFCKITKSHSILSTVFQNELTKDFNILDN